MMGLPRTWGLAIVAITMVLAALSLIEDQEQAHLIQSERLATLNQLSAVRARLEGEMNATLSLTRGLAAVIAGSGQPSAQQFQAVAREIMAQKRHIRNIGLTRGSTIIMVYPVEGNSAVLGRDLRSLPEQRDSIDRMFNNRQPVLAGPVPLVQGGVAMIGRMPIFTTPPQGDPGSGPAWGMISMPLNLHGILESCGINDSDLSLDLAIRGRDGLGERGEVFHGDPALFDHQPVLQSVSLPGGYWQIAAQPRGGWGRTPPPHRIYYRLLAGALCLGIIAMTALSARRTGQRRELDRQLTMLTAILNQIPNPIYAQDPWGGLLLTNQPMLTLVPDLAERQHPSRCLPMDQNDRHHLAQAEQAVLNGHHPSETLEICLYPGHPTAQDFVLHLHPLPHGMGLIGILIPKLHQGPSADDIAAAMQATQDAAKAKAEFMAILSHEIRTPMNSILGIIHLLRLSPLPAQQQEWVSVIDSTSESLVGILNDILDYSRLDAGYSVVHNEGFDIHELLQGVIAFAQVKVQDKGLALHLNTTPDLPRYVVGDRGRLRQILLNLIGNSCKFTPQGSISLTASTVDHSSTHIALRFVVEDTGIGIPAAAQPTLFMPFRQADAGISRRYGGTGLGLAICKKLVALLGGDMGMDSTEGKGSRFWFTLPLQAAAAADAPRLTAPRHQRIMPMSILLAEDNPVNRMVATHMLEFEGHVVHAVGNGEQAVRKLARTVFDMVLLDLDMPDMDGIQAAQRIRQLPGQGATIPIIAMTAHVSDGDHERCLRAGMNDTLGKPFRADELYAKLACWAPSSHQIDDRNG